MSLQYLIKRLLYLVVTAVVVSMIVFGITQILPANAAVMMLGEYATPDALAAVEERLGLNRPAIVQYLDWAFGILQGDMGNSLRTDLPVAPVVFEALGRSLILAGFSLLAVIVIAIPLGIYAALNRGRIGDLIASFFSYVGISMPEFVLATLLLVLLSRPEIGWFPASGYVPLSENFLKGLWHIALPVITLAIVLTAHVMRMVRSEMVDILHSDFVVAANMRGLSRFTVLVHHALRNSLLPTITVLALDVGYLIGGIIVVEEIFAFPGVGRLLIVALQERDLITLQAGALVMSVTYSIVNLLADMAYAYMDRRIQYD
jgi:peptide/nickel transport system permease protein